MANADDILEHLDRLSRLTASFNRRNDLNATQMAALSYLATAKGAARKPSKVAEYLAATRGTVSQTLKSLKRKGLLVEQPSATDGRSVEYALSAKGRKLAGAENPLLPVLSAMPEPERAALTQALDALISRLVEARCETLAPANAAETAPSRTQEPVQHRMQSAGSAPPFPG